MTLKTRFVFVVTGILIVFAVVNLWEKYAEENYPLAKISNLKIGYYNEDQVIVYSDKVPGTTSRLMACGHLESPHPKSITVGILKSNDSVYSASNDPKEEIAPGDFCVKLALKTDRLDPGDYELQVIDKHNIVAQKSFIVE